MQFGHKSQCQEAKSAFLATFWEAWRLEKSIFLILILIFLTKIFDAL
tara:strand:+ start:218 stop:358 length:141 start_codon:yes stop_codon:yes gene_type:complete